MKAKILLTGIVAPLCFAACTSEEVVPQQEATKIDLSARPTLGKVALGFGDQTRATLNEEGLFNSLKWTDTDAVGARIIDTPNATMKNYVNPFLNYTVSPTFASTNYKFEKGAGTTWGSEALMVEGNYMFYAPYDEKALYRDPLKMVFPVEQEIDPKSEQMANANANTDAIRNFFEDNTTTTVVGYKFLSAKSPEKVVSPIMTHIYAYPQITLKNNYTVDEDSNPSTPAVAKPISIEKIVLTADNDIYKNYKIDQVNLAAVLQDAVEEVKDLEGYENNDPQDAGDWRNGTTLLQYGRTSTIATGTNETSVIVTFKNGLTIDADDEFKFHVVLPAEEYNGNLTMAVYTTDGKAFVESGTTLKQFKPAATKLTYAPGKRYAKEEYNFEDGDYEIKDGTAGELATFTLEGNVADYVEPVYIENADDFEDFVKGLNNNTALVEEFKAGSNTAGAATFVLQQNGKDKYALMSVDDSVVAIRNKYLSAGKITFFSDMKIDGNITLDDNYKFNGKIKQTSGNLTLKSSVAGDATFNGTVTLDGAKLAKTATFKAATITNADIKGAIEFNGNATVKTLTSATDATVKSGVVTIHESSNAALDIAIEGGEVILNKANYISDNKTITVGSLKDDASVKNTGTLKINANNTLGNVTLNGGELVVGKDVTATGIYWSLFGKNWKNGTVTNNGKLQSYRTANFYVPENCKFVHNGEFVGSVNVENVGTVENNKSVNVINKGTITAVSGSHTTVVAGGTGTINNDALAYVGGDLTNQTVYYTFTKAVNADDINNFKSTKYNINKIVFTKSVEIKSEFNATAMTGVTALDFEQGSSLYVDAKVGINVSTININGNVEFSGFSKEDSGIGFKKSCAINVKQGKTWEVSHISMAAMNSANTIAIDSDDVDAAGKNKAKVEMDNAYIGLNSAWTADKLTNGAEVKKQWNNGSGWTNY